MITSTSNNRIKNIIRLITSSKARREQNSFIVEGVKMFMEAPCCDVLEVFVSEDYYNRLNEDIKSGNGEKSQAVINKLDETGFEIVSTDCFKKMSDTVNPQGILSVVKQNNYSCEELIKDKDSLRVLILDNVQDPGNLGTMLRTAEGAGFDFVLAGNNTVDVYNPKVIRSTMGSVYRVPICYVKDLPAAIRLLKSNGVKLFAAHLRGENYYYSEDFTGRVGIMIGNEGNGLSDEIANMADTYIKIPMEGQVESLNASVAAAILMYECVR